MEIKDIYDLRAAYYEKNPGGHYFDQDTLRFFGETMSSMRLLKGTVKVTSISGDEHTCYMVSKLSKGYNGKKRRTYAYFDVETLRDVIC